MEVGKKDISYDITNQKNNNESPLNVYLKRCGLEIKSFWGIFPLGHPFLMDLLKSGILSNSNIRSSWLNF